VIPRNQDTIVYTYDDNQNHIEAESYKDIFSGLYQGVVLRLMKWEGSKMEQRGDKLVLCNHQHANIKFSKDGTMFAIYCKEDGDIKIFSKY